jgi:hypothetical protein
MVGTVKIDPIIRKKDTEEYFTLLSVDEDAIEKDISSIVLTNNYNLNVEFQLSTKDLYRLALLIVNRIENENIN